MDIVRAPEPSKSADEHVKRWAMLEKLLQTASTCGSLGTERNERMIGVPLFTPSDTYIPGYGFDMQVSVLILMHESGYSAQLPR